MHESRAMIEAETLRWHGGRWLAFVVVLPTVMPSLAVSDDSPSTKKTEWTRYTPGAIYQEFTHHADGNEWRVTDGDATKKFPERAANFLPNPVRELTGVDLENAVAAEVTLDRWGGHRGTINKRVRFNGNGWITIPEIQDTPAGIRPEMLMFQDNPTVSVPLAHLSNGINTFEGDCDEAGGFGWGQWGLYSMILRVYYAPAAMRDKLSFDTEITSPLPGSTLSENPIVEVKASSKQGIVRVEVLSNYEGFDEDGDGDHGGWHESRFQLGRGQPNDVRNHVGTRWRQPYRFVWDTSLVPDQPQDGVQLIARVQDARGYWIVTEPVTCLTLTRDGTSVRIFHAQDVPEDFAVRVGQTLTCDIPVTDVPSSWTPVSAGLHLRTWHGDDVSHSPIKINDFEVLPGGKNHHYDYDVLDIASSAIRNGSNTFTIHSETEHHMLEVLWPGPSLVVRYALEPTAQP